MKQMLLIFLLVLIQLPGQAGDLVLLKSNVGPFSEESNPVRVRLEQLLIGKGIQVETLADESTRSGQASHRSFLFVRASDTQESPQLQMDLDWFVPRKGILKILTTVRRAGKVIRVDQFETSQRTKVGPRYVYLSDEALSKKIMNHFSEVLQSLPDRQFSY